MHPCMEAIPTIAIRVNVLLVCMCWFTHASQLLGTDATTVYAGIPRRYTFVTSDDCYCYVR